MCQVAAVECALHNGRADSELVNQSGKSLWRRGFMCLSHQSSVQDFHDTDQVEQVPVTKHLTPFVAQLLTTS